MHEFLQMPVKINLLVIILNAQTHPYVIPTDGPFYYNDCSEVAKKYNDSFMQIVIVMTYAMKQGLGFMGATKDILPEPFPLQGICANSVTW